MATSGLLAILDDLSSMLDGSSGLEDIGAEKATKLAQGGLVDDIKKAHAAKTGVDHRHEMAVVMKIARGALKNKILYFIPTTFAIAAFAPSLVMPLCIGSGAYIAYEGVKRLESRRNPKAKAVHDEELKKARLGGKETLLRYEKEKISQAIKTDAALTLELTGFQVGMTASMGLIAKMAVISAVSISATAGLYASVMGIIGINYMAHKLAETEGKRRFARAKRAVGRTMSRASSPMMKGIGFVGMTALFFVGGHLLAAYIPGVPEALASAGKAVVGATSPWLAWPVSTGMDIATGLVGGVVSYTGARTVGAVHKFLRRNENGLYSRLVKKIVKTETALVRKKHAMKHKLCKAFAKVSGAKCEVETPAQQETHEPEVIVLDKKKPVRRRRTTKKPMQRKKPAQKKKPAQSVKTTENAKPVSDQLSETFSGAAEKPAVKAPVINDNDKAQAPVRKNKPAADAQKKNP